MSRHGDFFVRLCTRLGGVPASSMCVFFACLQAGLLDYYLVRYLGTRHLGWIAGDVIVLALLIASIAHSASIMAKQRQRSSVGDENHAAADASAAPTSGGGATTSGGGATTSGGGAISMGWVAWLAMHLFLACKVIVIFTTFSLELEEESGHAFFGPNTLKTAIALGSVVFVLLLTTQHDAPLATDRRKYIEELTGTVIFDLLDTADILEILFDAEERASLASGVVELILVVATVNLLLPTVPLITLSKTRFGHSKLQRRLIYWHKLLVVLAVNVPNLVVRMILWHGFGAGVSPFTLKNVLLIAMTLYEFYEHKLEKYEQHQREEREEREMKEVGEGSGDGYGGNQGGGRRGMDVAMTTTTTHQQQQQQQQRQQTYGKNETRRPQQRGISTVSTVGRSRDTQARGEPITDIAI